jgi:hypothetical protein
MKLSYPAYRQAGAGLNLAWYYAGTRGACETLTAQKEDV